MKRAICSGSFDPVTNGHIDIFERASVMFDELIVCVFNNMLKKSFLPVEQRVALIEEAVRHLPNVKVDSFSGLVTKYMEAHDAHIIVRGVRSVKDLEYEQTIAAVNHALDPNIETVLLIADTQHRDISSTLVREQLAHQNQ